MAKQKILPTDVAPLDFVRSVANTQQRQDCETLLKLMQEASGEEPRMWGDTMIGFGEYHYKYDTGHSGSSFLVGFSPRKQNITIYSMAGFEAFATLLSKLGKCKTAKSCLYIKKLSDVDLEVLRTFITESATHMRVLHNKG